jgi:hypothetical protein
MSSTEAPAGADGGTLLLNQPVVIDNGTASIKAGFAGSSKPKVSRLKQYFSSVTQPWVTLLITVIYIVTAQVTLRL